MTHEIDDAAIDQEAGTGSVWELRGKVEALETENAKLRAELAAERVLCERYLLDKNQITQAWANELDLSKELIAERDELRAELAARDELLKEARDEFKASMLTISDRATLTWKNAWALIARIDAVLKGDDK